MHTPQSDLDPACRRPRQAWTLCAGILGALSGCALMAPTIPERARVAVESGAFPAPAASWAGVALGDAQGGAAQARSGVAEPPAGSAERPAATRLVLPGDPRGSLQLRGVALAQALHQIADLAGINLYIDPTLDRTIDAAFPDANVTDALHALLARNGLELVEDPPGIYWVRGADAGGDLAAASFELAATDTASVIEAIRGLVGQGTIVVADASHNFVMVRGPRREIELVSSYLEHADRQKPQVLVEVEIVEVSLDDRFALGISHEVLDGELGSSTITLMQTLASPESSFTLEFANDSVPIETTLDALRRYAGVNTLASPRVLALTNAVSHIDVTTEIPYIQATTTTDVASGGVGSSSTQQVAFKEVGIRLEVTPTVQAGGVVLLALTQELSEVKEFFQGIPVVDTREMQTSFLVENGRTIVLGGLLENRVVETDSGVPLLMDLPFVGRLFRSDDDRGERRELLLFVTPRVLDPEHAAELAGRVRSDYRARVERSGAPVGGGF